MRALSSLVCLLVIAVASTSAATLAVYERDQADRAVEAARDAELAARAAAFIATIEARRIVEARDEVAAIAHAEELCAPVRPMLASKFAREETRAIALSTATTRMGPTSGNNYGAYECTTTASTTGTGIYVVTPGTATATITNGYGPYCTDIVACPLGPVITAESGNVSLQAASATPTVRCRFGIQ